MKVRKKCNTLKNKVWSVSFILFGVLAAKLTKDLTALVLSVTLGIPTFFAKTNWIN